MKVYIMLADGFEEIEALTVVDVLRRAEVETIMVSVQEPTVTSAHGIKVIADEKIDSIKVNESDMIVLPGGGKGVNGLASSEKLIELLKEHNARNGLLAAICAGPTIPGKLGFFNGRRATCYPGCEKDLLGATIPDEDVVIDDNFITSKGPGMSLKFAIAILAKIKGRDEAEGIKSGMLYNE